MTQINTEQVLTISLKDIGFLNVGDIEEMFDAKTTGVSGYGCPDCNEERPNNRLEIQEDGTFWCHCCGVVWELYDTSKEMSTTQKIKYIKTMKVDPIFAAMLEARKQDNLDDNGGELTYCPVCNSDSYWGANGGSGAYGVVFCDGCDEQYDLEREEASTGEYHGSVFGSTK